MSRLLAAAPLALLVLAMASAIMADAGSQAPAGWVRSCTVHIVAVSGSGEGVLGNLTVTIHYPGSGKVYISTSPATEVDTQGSARLAAFAASLVAGVDMTRYDFYYDIESPSIIVGGPSAGAAMALATLDLLTGTPCNSLVDVTGMIQPDASIGPVGGLKAKLEAAAQGGARLFIVPAGQEVYTYYETRYERIGPIVWVVREPVTVNLTEYGERLGVRVEAAATLLQLYEIATNKTLPAPQGAPGSLPPWFTRALTGFVNVTVERVNTVTTRVAASYSIVREVLYNATEEAGRALRESRASPYKAAIDAVDAEAYALEGLYMDEALVHRFEVTGTVREVNESLLEAWDRVSGFSDAARGSIQYLLLARAYGMLGVAAFYYTTALGELRESGGHYYVPVSILGGADFRGVAALARARALVDWALFWANTSSEAPQGSPVPPGRLESLSSLLQAEARTAVAYLDRLLAESGASRPLEARLAEWLADTALTTRNPTAVIGLSIESIASSTAAIHETFTLRPVETGRQMLMIAEEIEPSGGISVVSRALEGLAGSGGGELSLIAASKAVLYAWLERMLSTAAQQAWMTSSQGGGVEHPAPTAISTKAPAPTGGTLPEATPERRSLGGVLEVGLAAVVSSAVTALVCAALRGGRP
jgi:uncharacterized protein